MERRVTSHTEEEEMNQRRRLLTLARKGDQKAVDQLFELYQVRVFSGDSLKRKKLPTFPVLKAQNVVPEGSYAPEKKEEKSVGKSSGKKWKEIKGGVRTGQKSKKKPLKTKLPSARSFKKTLEKKKNVTNKPVKKKGVSKKSSLGSKRGKIKKTKSTKSSSGIKRKISKKPVKKKIIGVG